MSRLSPLFARANNSRRSFAFARSLCRLLQDVRDKATLSMSPAAAEHIRSPTQGSHQRGSDKFAQPEYPSRDGKVG